jgi:hypothetical protein
MRNYLSLSRPIYCPECHIQLNVLKMKLYLHGSFKYIIHDNGIACSRAGESTKLGYNNKVRRCANGKGRMFMQFPTVLCSNCKSPLVTLELLPCKLRVKFRHSSYYSSYCTNSVTHPLALYTVQV